MLIRCQLLEPDTLKNTLMRTPLALKTIAGEVDSEAIWVVCLCMGEMCCFKGMRTTGEYCVLARIENDWAVFREAAQSPYFCD